MKKVISLIGVLLIITCLKAQTAVGKWKLILGSTLSVKGQTTDLLSEDYQKQPCLKNVIYTFEADGKIITNADHCPDSTKKDLEVSNIGIKWEASGSNKIIITTKNNDIDPLTYDLIIFLDSSLGKKIMIWNMSFNNKPDTHNPDPVKTLTFRFHEL
jgi:hypothetical protein